MRDAAEREEGGWAAVALPPSPPTGGAEEGPPEVARARSRRPAVAEAAQAETDTAARAAVSATSATAVGAAKRWGRGDVNTTVGVCALICYLRVGWWRHCCAHPVAYTTANDQQVTQASGAPPGARRKAAVRAAWSAKFESRSPCGSNDAQGTEESGAQN